LCAMITEYFGPQTKRLGRKQALGLFKAVVVTLRIIQNSRNRAGPSAALELGGEVGPK